MWKLSNRSTDWVPFYKLNWKFTMHGLAIWPRSIGLLQIFELQASTRLGSIVYETKLEPLDHLYLLRLPCGWLENQNKSMLLPCYSAGSPLAHHYSCSDEAWILLWLGSLYHCNLHFLHCFDLRLECAHFLLVAHVLVHSDNLCWSVDLFCTGSSARL